MILDRFRMVGNATQFKTGINGNDADKEEEERGREKFATVDGEKNDGNAAGEVTPTSHRSSGSNTVNDDGLDEESLEVRLERLGRERPACFRSTWREAGFVFSISMSQVLAV